MDTASRPAAGARGAVRAAGIGRSSRRRRPSGRPPPLPHPLQTTGVGWLTATVVLVALSVLVFAGELRGPAVAVTVVDDAVVGWLAGLDGPGLSATMKVLAAPGSWVAITVLLWGLLLALLILQTVAASARRGDRVDAAGVRSSSTCWGRCCVGRGRSGWSSGPIGTRGRCRPSRWPRSRSRWSGSCTPWCRRAAGVRPASGRRRRWWRWSPSPACTSGWRRPPMWSWVW